jgi:hypothetical protein
MKGQKMPENNIENICQSLLSVMERLTKTSTEQLMETGNSTPRIEKIDFDKFRDELGFVALHLKDYSREKNDNELSRKWLADRICAFRRAYGFLQSQSPQSNFDELKDCTMATLIREYENQASQLRRNVSNDSRQSISCARRGAEFAQYKS